MKGLIIVLSSPSGGGKTTVCRELLQRHPEFYYSVSVTTRTPRSGEEEGKDYRFVSREEFERQVAENRFVEWAEVHGNYYGTPRGGLEESCNEGKDSLLDVDVQGGMAIKKQFPEAVLIFIIPPSEEILKRRLRTRGTETVSELNKRLAIAREELACYHEYDYVVVNEEISTTIRQIEAIITAERLRSRRVEVMPSKW